MKKIFTLLAVALAFAANAEKKTINVTITWPMAQHHQEEDKDADGNLQYNDDNSVKMKTVYTNDLTPVVSAGADAITVGEPVLGSKINWGTPRSINGKDFALIQPTAKANALQDISEGNTISFQLETKDGYTFQPIGFDYVASVIGTDGGKYNLTYTWNDATTNLQEAFHPNRNNEAGGYFSTETLEIKDAADASGKFDVTFNVYDLATNKQIGISAVVIKGQLTGEFADETPEPAEGESFTVQGNGAYTWGKSFDDVVMPFEYEAQTRVATISNIFDSDCTVKVQFVIKDTNKNPNMTGTTFKAKEVSGFASVGAADQQGQYFGKIEGFTGSLILKQNGVNAVKLENVDFGLGNASSMEVATDATSKEKVYAFEFGIQGKYYSWDADKSEWVAATGPRENDFVYLKVSIPFVAGPTSGLDSVIAEDENAPVEYYNLQGVRIAEPAAGQIVIRRQGSKVQKLLVR